MVNLNNRKHKALNYLDANVHQVGGASFGPIILQRPASLYELIQRVPHIVVG